jgi:hypothetical protein
MPGRTVQDSAQCSKDFSVITCVSGCGYRFEGYFPIHSSAATILRYHDSGHEQTQHSAANIPIADFAVIPSSDIQNTHSGNNSCFQKNENSDAFFSSFTKELLFVHMKSRAVREIRHLDLVI